MGRMIGRFRRRGDRGEKLWNEPGASSGGLVDQPAKDSEAVTYPDVHGITPGADEEDAARTSDQGVGKDAHERAVSALREFLAQNTTNTNVERAVRMRDQAERLEREGIPSDSARNRAERAREELVDDLVRLRRALSAAGGRDLARALDLEVMKLDPPIQPGEIHR